MTSLSADQDPLQQIAQQREWLVRAHSRLLESSEFRDQQRRLNKLSTDFAVAIKSIWLMASRAPRLTDDFLLFRRIDDAIESAFAMRNLAADGMLYAARREQRYLLEAFTKYLATDQQRPEMGFSKRVGFFEREIAKRSVAPIEDVQLFLLSDGAAQRFREKVQSEFDRLSTFVHASVEQVRARTADAGRGAYLGFETPTQVRAVVDEAHNVFGLALVLALHGLGHSLAGDLFTTIWDHETDWSFASHEFIVETSKGFDYKHERRSR
jgi:hypothetical protein